MAYAQSPGIITKEHDLTGIVPGVATTEAGIGGVFSWGPVEDPDLISNENELINRFGKPTDDNFETFYIAANFLSYADALWVSRAADANSFNAVANTGAVAGLQIKNETDFTVKQATVSANSVFYARYPGNLGNSLKVSVCDSANAYQTSFTTDASKTIELNFTRNTFAAELKVTDSVGANSTVATTLIESILDDLQVGDYIRAYNSNVGAQHLRISAIGTASANSGTASATISFSNRYTMAEDISVENFTRHWEFFNVVERAPGTSPFADTRGGVGDEMHIVVVDEDGKFTGTPGTIVESWSSLSRAKDATGEQGGSLYYKDVINTSSRFIYAVNDRPGAASVNNASTSTAVDTKVASYSFSGGTDSMSETTIPLGALARAYDRFKNPEEIDVSILIAGKSVGGIHGEGIANYIIDNVAETRRDLVVSIAPAFSDVVSNPYLEAESIIQFRSALRKSSYAAVTSGYKYQYDRYNEKYRWVNDSGDLAGLMSRTDKDRDPWWSPAGHNRGVYKNVVKLAYNPDQADRDLLYKNDINPVVTMRGSGTILYGDKTLLGHASAFDRINVRRLFITLEKAIKEAAKQFLFEFNDAQTRARFRNMVEPYLRNVQGRRGITDFKVVCDESNNTGYVIDSNNFIGDIYIKPARSINYITLNFVAVGTDVRFDYVVGQF